MSLRILKSLWCVTLLIGIFAQSVSASSKTVTIKVTLVRAELVENNHVGNEWATAVSVNGKALEEGKTIALKLKTTGSFKLEAQAEEQDKIPDFGTANFRIKASSITKELKKSINVTVVENRGRYSGNTAKWKFTFVIDK
jgi:hypothetical protein